MSSPRRTSSCNSWVEKRHYVDRHDSNQEKRKDRSDYKTRRGRSPTGRRQCGNNRYNKEEPWSKELRQALSAPGSGQSDISTTDTSDSEISFKKKPTGKVSSGIDAKPGSRVKQELMFPHFSLGQTSAFMGVGLQFHAWSYEQFVAGELCTIMNTVNSTERRGRVSLLHKICTWKLTTGVSWVQICNTYAHIVRLIENHEIDWVTDFNQYERHIFEKVTWTKEKTKSVSNNKTPVEWFCKQFQKIEGCIREPLHIVKYGNQT